MVAVWKSVCQQADKGHWLIHTTKGERVWCYLFWHSEWLTLLEHETIFSKRREGKNGYQKPMCMRAYEQAGIFEERLQATLGSTKVGKGSAGRSCCLRGLRDIITDCRKEKQTSHREWDLHLCEIWYISSPAAALERIYLLNDKSSLKRGVLSR